MTVYAYRGTHDGPDSFDTTTDQRTNHTKDTVTPFLRAELEAGMAYWYARGYTDREVAEAIGTHQKAVLGWRQKNGHRSNFIG